MKEHLAKAELVFFCWNKRVNELYNADSRIPSGLVICCHQQTKMSVLITAQMKI